MQHLWDTHLHVDVVWYQRNLLYFCIVFARALLGCSNNENSWLQMISGTTTSLVSYHVFIFFPRIYSFTTKKKPNNKADMLFVIKDFLLKSFEFWRLSLPQTNSYGVWWKAESLPGDLQTQLGKYKLQYYCLLIGDQPIKIHVWTQVILHYVNEWIKCNNETQQTGV